MSGLLAGATGLVGRELAKAWDGPGDLVMLLRGPAPAGLPTGPRLRSRLVDYTALMVVSTAGPAATPAATPETLSATLSATLSSVSPAALHTALPTADEAYCCLGTTIARAGSQAAFRAVDFDAVLAFARAAQAAGVKRLGVVSALGAQSDSSSFYSRVKGEVEAELSGMNFSSLVLARPSMLAGNRSAIGQPGRLGEQLALLVTLPLGRLVPAAWRPIQASVVALALLRAVREGRPGRRVLSSAEMQSLGTR